MKYKITLDENDRKTFEGFALYLKMVKRVDVAYCQIDFYDGNIPEYVDNHWFPKNGETVKDNIFKTDVILSELFEDGELHDKIFSDTHFDSYSRVNVYINPDERKVWFDGAYQDYGTEESEASGSIPDDVLEKLGGVGIFTCTYSGGGDSGYIDENDEGRFDGVGGNMVAFYEYAYKILQREYGGWEINEGSSGTITIDTIEKEYYIEHSWNTEEMVDVDDVDVYFNF